MQQAILMTTDDLNALIDERISQALANVTTETGVGNLTWFKQQICLKSSDSAKQKILFNPEFRKELEAFVYYPKAKGEPWKFNKKQTLKWLEKNGGKW